ncbi:hypothetical protein Q0812_05775 [Brevundimonas sp. 2R-24]|uniref:Uncharacterized protein n=1 Tax=Peiella sedimenti TaxID=3061083 RepID=A0ABT8SM53_9CAUL|nr:hypothetical protein [Caulobacteraceae bacterium XZ-24]
MTCKTVLTSVLTAVLAASAPALALDPGGNGNGKGRDGDRAEARGDRGGGPDRSDERGRGRDRDRDQARPQPVARFQPDDDRGRGRDEAPGQARRNDDRREDRPVRPQARPDDRREDRRLSEAARSPERLVFRSAPGLIDGCPPGLAKRDNGCLPPGQARRIEAERRMERERWENLWRWPAYGGDRYRYRYDDGYLYRMSQQGGLLGYLPVLGGALAPQQIWPDRYDWDPAPAYYSRYYGLPDDYAYRYADGVLYGVDPDTQRIAQVAALLTGQPWTVGQPMPVGYDVYNVPYDYRARYVDSPQALYRYSDGYVYQVDPTTRLVQAVIELLT